MFHGRVNQPFLNGRGHFNGHITGVYGDRRCVEYDDEYRDVLMFEELHIIYSVP